ncbi:ABC transporter ATP-binding protein [uncultured Desulfuromusa sp.]|uniref:energy-coupling factor ABC transporter ATP-binding protein n=1 Tax=uncultured Desulfuromusa sp. TaxID=219183 RepID=UPI002AA708DF|nr:ABC transporter ATP-binding protein [uncultured Desulfuromusa sp.]
MIEIEDFSYTYPSGQAPALENISLSISAGEFVAVIGANESGKSTLAYALTGFVPHFFKGKMSGRISVAGLDTQQTPLSDLASVAGLVFQNPVNQISGVKFNVYDEVAFGLENLGVPREQMGARIDAVLELTGLSNLGERSPYELSGGQQQRLALASMLVMQPQVLVLDEPTSQLDPLGSQNLFLAVQQLSRQGMTVIMAEHKLEWIAAFADRVIVLSAGKVVLDGAADVVLTSPLLDSFQIERTRFTRVAEQARKLGLWPEEKALPVTLDQALSGFRHQRKGGADNED